MLARMEASEEVPERPVAAVAAPAPAAARGSRPVALWLLACTALVFVMIVLGGLTRLTHSGLSMVDWRPITGILPPLTEADWERAFAAYRQYPEYREINRGMDLAGFQSIFWLEYVHRLWGRLIGVAFLLPLLCFVLSGRIQRTLAWRLGGVFVLGALQGALGWFMVRSGLVDRPDVSQYRLAAHLGLALVLYGYLLWVALGLLRPPAAAASRRLRGARREVAALGCAVVLTALSGAFVAGTGAGLAYNTFPLMGERLVPAGLLALEPALRNLFENIVTVQFVHRVLALATFAGVVVVWRRLLRRPLEGAQRAGAHALLAAGVLQVSLGISTLLLHVPVALAAAHQAGALLLLGACLLLLRALGRTTSPAAAPCAAAAGA